MFDKLKPYQPHAIVVAMLAVTAFIWHHYTPKPAPVEQWTPAKPAPQLQATPKTTIAPPKVAVFVPAAKGKLDLPPEVQADPKQHVINATVVASDDHPQTITTVIDDQTGEVQTFVRREPLPWLAAEQRGELRFDVGIKQGLARVGRLSVREDLLQVKALHAGLNASIDTDLQFFVGGGVGYRW